MLAYLRVIHSLKDRAALVRIINVPNRRMGDTRIAVLVKDSDTKSRPMWDSIRALLVGEIRFTMKDTAAEAALGLFVRNIETVRKKLSSNEIKTVSDLIDYIRTQVNYDDHLRKKFGPEAEERISNLEELKTFSKEIELMMEENVLPEIGVGENQEEESALERFLGNIALMTDIREDQGEDEIVSSVSVTFKHADY
jgi:DNA helicase II / ATP-dependent DNA helicase PcrA